MFDLKRIMELLPHRYPFLLVDRIEEIVPGDRVVGIKCVTANEPFFAGHFPGNPVMPGVLIVEALAQTAAVLGYESSPEYQNGGGVLLMGLDRVRFRRPVVPGDVLRLEAEVLRARSSTWRLKTRATVEGERAAEAELLAQFFLPEAT